MLNATEVFQHLDTELRTREGEQHPFADALSLQLRLASQIERLIQDAEHSIVIPPHLEGEYLLQSDYPRPHSSTGEVLFIERADDQPHTQLAVKLLLKLDTAQNFLPNPDQTYAFEHPAVRTMTALGESLMGKAANRVTPTSMYHGVANLERIAGNSVVLQPFDLQSILNGNAEPVVVMRQMEQSLADVLLDVHDAIQHNQPRPYSSEQLRQWTKQVFDQVLNSSIGLPEDIAADIGSPEEVEALLTGKTIGWLVSRVDEPGIAQTPVLLKAVQNAVTVQEGFRRFFAMPETQVHLQRRAKPYVGKGENARLAQTFSSGDTKFGNVMIGANGSGRPEVGLFDPQWLILKPGAIGNEKHMFAPWPFADLMQIMAYTAAQPSAYGFPVLKQAIFDGLRQYYGPEHWTNWHELYLQMLVAYKLLVDVAYNIDPYLDKLAHDQPIPRQLKWIIETHAREAVQVTNLAFRSYDGVK